MAVSFGSDGPLLQLITQEHKRKRGQASAVCNSSYGGFHGLVEIQLRWKAST